jgi:hypothetical protein
MCEGWEKSDYETGVCVCFFESLKGFCEECFAEQYEPCFLVYIVRFMELIVNISL